MKSLPRSPAAAKRAGDRLHLVVERLGAVERGVAQIGHLGARSVAGQPFGDAFVFRIVDGGIEDAVDRRRRHAAQPQDRGRLVGGREDRERAPLAPPPALVVARDGLDTGPDQRAGQFRQQHRLARARLAQDRQHRIVGIGVGRVGLLVQQADAGLRQHLGQPVPGQRLIVREDGRGGLGGRDGGGGVRHRRDARRSCAAREATLAPTAADVARTSGRAGARTG
jgi:hypothetical protein